MLRELARVGIFGQDRLDLVVPEDLARVAVETDHVPPQVLFVALVSRVGAIAGPTGNHDALANHDGAGRSGPGQLGLPFQVLGFAPGDGKRLLVEADAAAARPVEPRPIRGRRESAEEQ